MVKNPPANAGDTGDSGLIPGLGRFPGVGNGNPLQYSCWENPMDRAWGEAAVHGVTKSRYTHGGRHWQMGGERGWAITSGSRLVSAPWFWEGLLPR